MMRTKQNMDPKERSAKAAEINANPRTREELEEQYGKDNVWDTKELQEVFSVDSFLAPYCFVIKKSDGRTGVVGFQHAPRFYFHAVFEDEHNMVEIHE